MDNPPAFARPSTANGTRQDGMSLRDWFAGQALVSMGTWMPPSATARLIADETMRARAGWAYRHADAMLAERAKAYKP